ncbi:MAG: hypothetical protein JO284_19890 [Planctomycetaceae bacterium]|nr:hypothetical protein [Planctomycetaceae bacterium]
MRGQTLSTGKAQYAACHPAPDYTDNSMRDLKVERFDETQTIDGLAATREGPIKTFNLRGLKDVGALLSRRPAAHAGGCRQALQPDLGDSADRRREGRPRRVPAAVVSVSPR